jgi:hypothetical protein
MTRQQIVTRVGLALLLLVGVPISELGVFWLMDHHSRELLNALIIAAVLAVIVGICVILTDKRRTL